MPTTSQVICGGEEEEEAGDDAMGGQVTDSFFDFRELVAKTPSAQV